MLCYVSSPTKNLDRSNVEQSIANCKIMFLLDGIMELEEKWKKKIDKPNNLILILDICIFLEDGHLTCAQRSYAYISSNY